MARSTFTLLGIFFLATIAAAAVVPEIEIELKSQKNLTKRSPIKVIKHIGDAFLDTVDGAIDFFTAGLFRNGRKHPNYPVSYRPISSIDELQLALESKDEDGIINSLIGKNFWARETVSLEYYRKFGRELKDEFFFAVNSDSLRSLLESYVTKKWDFYAKEIYDGLNDFSGDAYAPMEVLCTPYPEDIENIRNAYRRNNMVDLIEDLRYQSSDPSMRDSLMRFAQGLKIGKFEFSPDLINRAPFGMDDPRYNEVLCTKNGNRFFAERLYQYLRSNDSRGINRMLLIILNHGMVESVMRAFEDTYMQSLQDAVNRYTHGTYRNALMMIIFKATAKMDLSNDILYMH